MPALDQPTALQGLTVIFREIFENPTLELREDMTAADIPEWDSLNHIDLIVAVERKFRVKFTTRDVAALKTVGDLAELTAKKVSAIP